MGSTLPEIMRYQHLEMLHQMKGLHRLAAMLCPDLRTLADASLLSAAGMVLAGDERPNILFAMCVQLHCQAFLKPIPQNSYMIKDTDA